MVYNRVALNILRNASFLSRSTARTFAVSSSLFCQRFHIQTAHSHIPATTSSKFILKRNYCSSSGDIMQFNVEFEEFKGLVKDPKNFVVDVREPKELVDDGKIAGAVNIPLGQVDAEFTHPAGDLMSKYSREAVAEDGSNVVFFCKGGVRAAKALNMANQHGYSKARFYKGSFMDWVAKGGEVVK